MPPFFDCSRKGKNDMALWTGSKHIEKALAAVTALALITLTGCQADQEDKDSLISGVEAGMTKDAVLSVIGEDYDNSATTETYKNTVEYDYYFESDEVFGTGLSGYMFVEFSLETDKLITYGYHLGQDESFKNPSYKYSEEELKTAFDAVINKISVWYGDENPDSHISNENDTGLPLSYTFNTESGEQLWAAYGVNMWGSSEPDSYEKGINEVVVSCTIDY